MSADNFEKKTFSAGNVIYAEGEIARELFLIKRGSIRIVKLNQNRIITTAILGEGDVFGASSLFTKSQRKDSAIAIDDTVVIPIKKSLLYLKMTNIPSWVNDVISTVCERLSEADNIICENKIEDSRLTRNLEYNPTLDKKIVDEIRRRGGGV